MLPLSSEVFPAYLSCVTSAAWIVTASVQRAVEHFTRIGDRIEGHDDGMWNVRHLSSTISGFPPFASVV